MLKLACLEVSRLIDFFAAFWSCCNSIVEAESNLEWIHLNRRRIHTSLGRHRFSCHSGKLQTHWFGPYEVIDVNPNGSL